MKTLINLSCIFLLIVLVGCDEEKRMVELARESTTQQASQNKEMARVNQELARSRSDQVRLQQDLQKQQTQINTQRDELESERRGIAEERRRESILAPILDRAGLIIACATPLVLAGYALCKLNRSTGEDLSDFLVDELMSKNPKVVTPKSRASEPPRRFDRARGCSGRNRSTIAAKNIRELPTRKD